MYWPSPEESEEVSSYCEGSSNSAGRCNTDRRSVRHNDNLTSSFLSARNTPEVDEDTKRATDLMHPTNNAVSVCSFRPTAKILQWSAPSTSPSQSSASDSEDDILPSCTSRHRATSHHVIEGDVSTTDLELEQYCSPTAMME